MQYQIFFFNFKTGEKQIQECLEEKEIFWKKERWIFDRTKWDAKTNICKYVWAKNLERDVQCLIKCGIFKNGLEKKKEKKKNRTEIRIRMSTHRFEKGAPALVEQAGVRPTAPMLMQHVQSSVDAHS